jgi:hypothetical protein
LTPSFCSDDVIVIDDSDDMPPLKEAVVVLKRLGKKDLALAGNPAVDAGHQLMEISAGQTIPVTNLLYVVLM